MLKKVKRKDMKYEEIMTMWIILFVGNELKERKE